MKLSAKVRLKKRTYRHTYTGMLSDMWDKMSRRVQGKSTSSPKCYIGKELMTHRKFLDLTLQNRTIKRLYRYWKKHGFQLKHRPSPDRIKKSIGYIPSNLRFVTYGKNSAGAQRRKQS